MAYQQQPQQYQQQDIVPGEQYRYALTNFRIAHEKVEVQRVQLEEQERQVAQLRERIAVLEGGAGMQQAKGQNTIDDFSIRNAASLLDKLINRWAAEIVRTPPAQMQDICNAILSDVVNGQDMPAIEATPMQVQNLLRHAMSETISEGIVNCLIVTNSSDANVQLTRIHEHLFSRDPTVASVWRRQTFSAAVESCTPEMSLSILSEQVPSLMKLLSGVIPASGGVSILDQAYDFSRMLHGANASSGTADAFYRAFTPELGSTLYPRQIELVKRCLKSERSEMCRVGATIFPGLVKVTRGIPIPGNPHPDNIQASQPFLILVCHSCADEISAWLDCSAESAGCVRLRVERWRHATCDATGDATRHATGNAARYATGNATRHAPRYAYAWGYEPSTRYTSTKRYADANEWHERYERYGAPYVVLVVSCIDSTSSWNSCYDLVSITIIYLSFTSQYDSHPGSIWF
ncbi:hypothetical protein HGRIS_003339 [Hohenbuehelia grisea]|uniref:Uncharacterized protein n=1 Tax=Hohenbuehelia grisea TaxID=104357 RepID=A0ABR3JFV7_9AGAR